MKRIKIREEQYNNFLSQYETDNTNNMPQEISNMRHDVADLKQNELKVIARDYIATAFQLGCEYEKISGFDIRKIKEIVKKLNQLQAAVDTIN